VENAKEIVINGVPVIAIDFQKMIQYRFPKTKKRRIQKKWYGNKKNWRLVPDKTACYVIDRKIVCHTSVFEKIKKAMVNK
jgi:hypothetical protein